MCSAPGFDLGAGRGIRPRGAVRAVGGDSVKRVGDGEDARAERDGFPLQLARIPFAASLAAANADTWATELGVLSRTPPRLITNGKIVEVGTSGGVSLLGTQAAFSGSLLVAIIAYLAALFDPTLSVLRPSASPLLTTVAFAGLLGSLFDSLLGAAVQAIYYCDPCQKETERHPTHRCGAQTRMFRGWGWLDNDWVNFLATTMGAVLAALAFSGFSG